MWGLSFPETSGVYFGGPWFRAGLQSFRFIGHKDFEAGGVWGCLSVFIFNWKRLGDGCSIEA